MQKYKLKNGITLILEKRKTRSVAIEVLVKTGSVNESKNIMGISHFIEHMLFEGTKNRTQKEIADSIEKVGGELNAVTTNEYTTYYAVVLKKHFDKALEILADIIQNPLFNLKDINKERKVILSEIKLTTDQPRFYQWVLFQKTLFEKHSVKNPIYGYVKTMKGIKRYDILNYYKKYYLPNNLIISVVGNVNNIKNKVEKAFSGFISKKKVKKARVKEPKQKLVKGKIEKRQIKHSYLVLGYKVANRKSKESYALDLLKIILGHGQSSKLFEEIRTKRGLAYEVSCEYESGTDYGFFAVNLSTDKKNIKKVKEIILNEFKAIQNLSKKELEEDNNVLEGLFELEYENNHKRANLLNFYEMIKNVNLAKNYIKNIKKVSLKKVKKVAKKYLNDKYTLAILEQK